MKRHYYHRVSFLVLISMLMLSAALVYGAEESIVLTTYYPSPYGVYGEMRLYPKASATCNSQQEGLMYYDNNAGKHVLRVCGGSPLGWQDIGGGFWAASPFNSNNIYNTNSGSVGIGTNNPAEKLDVTGRAHFSDVIKSGNLLVANNIMSVVGMTDVGGFAVGFANGSGAIIGKNASLTGPGVGILDPGGVPAIGMAGGNPSYIEAYLGRDLQLKTATTNSVIYMKNSTGNVGIGTTSPAGKLHVVGNVIAEGAIFKSGNIAAVNNALSVWSPSGGFISGFSDGSAVGMGTSATGQIGFGANGPGASPYFALYREPADNWVHLQTYPAGRNLVLGEGYNVGIGGGMGWAWARLDVGGSPVNIPGLRTMNSAFNRYIFMVPELGPGGYNWLSQNGDSGIFFSNLGAGLVIGPWAGGSYGIRITASGNVGIGEPWPADKLRVNGNVSANDYWIGALARWASSFSDIRLKEKVQPLTGVLDRLRAIKCVSFNWNEAYNALGHPNDKRQIGVIAQDVEQSFPELVISSEDGGYKSVNYDGVTAVLLQAIKEQQKQIEDLREEIGALKTKIQ